MWIFGRGGGPWGLKTSEAVRSVSSAGALPGNMRMYVAFEWDCALGFEWCGARVDGRSAWACVLVTHEGADRTLGESASSKIDGEERGSARTRGRSRTNGPNMGDGWSERRENEG